MLISNFHIFGESLLKSLSPVNKAKRKKKRVGCLFYYCWVKRVLYVFWLLNLYQSIICKYLLPFGGLIHWLLFFFLSLWNNYLSRSNSGKEELIWAHGFGRYGQSWKDRRGKGGPTVAAPVVAAPSNLQRLDRERGLARDCKAYPTEMYFLQLDCLSKVLHPAKTASPAGS